MNVEPFTRCFVGIYFLLICLVAGIVVLRRQALLRNQVWKQSTAQIISSTASEYRAGSEPLRDQFSLG
ncbi:hypothetical protein [Salicola sp. Rm-C-2C1-2]|uniref:hypothetical protein n=1 Tax=Salicola sp. Rm-C-2C1-2 TaxID=3141321 RepID=UPI0032E431D1